MDVREESKLRKESRLNMAGRPWAAEFRLAWQVMPAIPCNKELRDAGRSWQPGLLYYAEWHLS